MSHRSQCIYSGDAVVVTRSNEAQKSRDKTRGKYVRTIPYSRLNDLFIAINKIARSSRGNKKITPHIKKRGVHYSPQVVSQSIISAMVGYIVKTCRRISNEKYGASLYEMAAINRRWRVEQLDVLRSQLGDRYLNGLVYKW